MLGNRFNMKIIKSLLLLTVLISSGCASNQAEPMNAEYQIKGFAHCNITEPSAFELLEIDQLKEQFKEPRSPLKAVAQKMIDQNRVFVIAQGQKPTLGYYQKITNFLMEGDYWQATVINMEPKKGMIVAQAISSPCTLIAVPKTVKGFTLLDQNGTEIQRW